jgi:hypothetical protein
MRTVPLWGVLSSAAAPTLLIGGWTVAARLQGSPFDSVSGTISALAADDAQHRWVMTAALVGVGAAHVTTALALRPAAPAARWVIAAGGVATVLVAANPLPSEGASAPRHFLAAGVAFVSLGIWPALSWRRRRIAEACEELHDHDDEGRTAEPCEEALDREQAALDRKYAAIPVVFRPEVAIPAAGVLLAGLGWFFAELVEHSDRLGLSERVAAGSQAVWPLIAVLAARRHQRGRRPGVGHG